MKTGAFGENDKSGESLAIQGISEKEERFFRKTD